MKKVIILVLLALITVPVIGQQHQIDLNAAFDKKQKCLVFTLKNNNQKQKVVLKHTQFKEGAGSYCEITAYDKEGKMITSYRSIFHPTDKYVFLIPREVIKTHILLDSSLLEYKIHKIQLHCVINDETYGDKEEKIKERYEKEYTFYWK